MPQVVGAVQIFAASVSAGGTIVSSLGAAFGSLGFAARLGATLLLSAASQALVKVPKAQNLSRDLAQPTSSPDVRFVYGKCRATGTPAGTPVKGDYIYGCWILNSRWSYLSDFKLYLDKREVSFTGDPFDFSGDGAIASGEPFESHLNFWISRGDQTSPPDVFLSEAPYGTSTDKEKGYWKDTDSWQGVTTIWMRVRAGDNRQTRWPSAPPFVEVEGDWSRVYDPRDLAQDFSDETTWNYSSNWALCVLDVLKSSPIRPYQELNLDLPSVAQAANISDEDQELKAGGTEKRYVVAGTLVLTNNEIEDQVIPMVQSAAGYLVRSAGKLGLVAASYKSPSQTHTDFLGSKINASDLVPTTDIINEVRTTYLSPERGFETAELSPYVIPNAIEQDGNLLSVASLNLPFCPSATQAMRVRKIFSGLSRRQKSLQVVLPPNALDLLPSSTIELVLPFPFNKFDGLYEVQSTHPAMNLYGSDGRVALEVPVSLVKHSPEIYLWDKEEEEEVVQEEDITLGNSISQTGPITFELEYANDGGSVRPQIKFFFDPSPSSAVIDYEYQYSTNGSFILGGFIDPDTRDATQTSKVFGVLPVIETESYVLRVRSRTAVGTSDWVESAVIDTQLTFTNLSATGDVGEVRFFGTTPVSSNFNTIRVFRNTTSDYLTSSLYVEDSSYGPDEPFSIVQSEPVGTAFYWVVPYTTTELEGTISGPFELTSTTP